MTKDTGFCQQGTEEIDPRYDECRSCGDDYMENQWDMSLINSELLLLGFKIHNTKDRHFILFSDCL